MKLCLFVFLSRHNFLSEPVVQELSDLALNLGSVLRFRIMFMATGVNNRERLSLLFTPVAINI